MMGLTHRQREALEFVRAHLEAYGFSPTVREIMAALGLGTNSTSRCMEILRALEEKGHVRRLQKRARGIELVQTEYYHARDCDCLGCADTRYFEQLKLFKALQVSPKSTLVPKLRGLKPVSELTKVYWLRGFPLSLKPRRSAA